MSELTINSQTSDFSLLGGQMTTSVGDVVQLTSHTQAPEYCGEVTYRDEYAKSMNVSEADHDIADFLGRYVQLSSSIMWTTTSTVPTPLFTLNVEDIFGPVPSFPELQIWRDKLKGIYAADFTFEVKLVVNAQPFQGGILGLGFFPGTKFIGSSWDQYIAGTDFSYLPWFSGNPGKWLNISEGGELTVCIPYVGPQKYFQFQFGGYNSPSTYDSSFGTFYVYPVTPLASTVTNDAINVAVFVRIKDYKPIGATLQADFPPSEEAQEKHTVRKAIDIVEAVADTPIVAAMVPEAPAVVGVVSGLASLFGFAKPTDTTAAEYMIPRSVTTNSLNMDGQSLSRKMAASKHHSIIPHSLGITPKDEMHFQHIARRENFLDVFQWKTTDAVHTILWGVPVQPTCRSFIDGTHKVASTNHLYAAASMFRYWSGSIEYVLNAAATKFHSGRLRLTYALQPFARLANMANTNEIPYYYQEIWDVRGAKVHKYVCPYISPAPMKEVPRVWNNGLFLLNERQHSGFDSDTALFWVEVLTPLVATAGATNQIAIVVSIAGGSDIEFDVPLRPTGEPWVNALPSKQHATLQSGSVIAPLQSHVGNSGTAKFKYHVGEKVTSLRSLVKRDQFWVDVPASTNLETMACFPWIYSVYSNARPSYIDYWASFFRFFSGGMRITIVSFAPNETVALGYSPENLELLDPTFTTTFPVCTCPSSIASVGLSAFSPASIFMEGQIAFDVPWQSRNHLMPTQRRNWTRPIMADAQNREIYPQSAPIFAMSAQHGEFLMRGACDDFSFGYLIGCPWIYFGEMTP